MNYFKKKHFIDYDHAAGNNGNQKTTQCNDKVPNAFETFTFKI